MSNKLQIDIFYWMVGKIKLLTKSKCSPEILPSQGHMWSCLYIHTKCGPSHISSNICSSCFHSLQMKTWKKWKVFRQQIPIFKFPQRWNSKLRPFSSNFPLDSFSMSDGVQILWRRYKNRNTGTLRTVCGLHINMDEERGKLIFWRSMAPKLK